MAKSTGDKTIYLLVLALIAEDYTKMLDIGRSTGLVLPSRCFGSMIGSLQFSPRFTISNTSYTEYPPHVTSGFPPHKTEHPAPELPRSPTRPFTYGAPNPQ